MTASALELALRIAGVSHVALGLAHLPLWRLFGWTRETSKLSPLTARVFAVHTFFVAFVVVALGVVAASRPELLLEPSGGARLFLGFSAIFWALRLAAQPLVFDPVLLRGSPWRLPVRAAAAAGFALYVAVYAWAFARQLDASLDVDLAALRPRPLDFAALPDVLRTAVAAVWIVFGVLFKLLRLVPRHERIVARILGDVVAPALTRVIGAGEAFVGLWMLSGVAAPLCASAQTALVVTMNAIELRRARDLLLAPLPMVAANAVLLAAAWFAALAP